MGVFSRHDDEDLYMGFVDDGGPIPETPIEVLVARDQKDLSDKRIAVRLLSLVRKRLASEVFLGMYEILHENTSLVKERVGYVSCTPRFLRKLRSAMGPEKKVPRDLLSAQEFKPLGRSGAGLLQRLLDENGFSRLAKNRYGDPETDCVLRDADALRVWADPGTRYDRERNLLESIARLEARLASN